MRGIPAACIWYHAEQQKITAWDIYNKSYGGEVLNLIEPMI